jgi:two-component system, NarL family, nitrate/nitrite response regulator NarL
VAAQTIPLAPDRSSRRQHRSDDPGPAIPTALICDNPLLRSGLQHILHGTPFLVGEVSSAAGLEPLQHSAPEASLVIIETNQDTGRALEAVRQVREWSPKTRIVVLADRFDHCFLRLGHAAGVDGFCLGASAPDVLIKSLELIMLGEAVLPSEVLRSILDGSLQRPEQPLHDRAPEDPKPSDLMDCKLSAKETQVLSHLRDGSSNKIIACKLDIAEATVKVHVKAILRKTGVTNRTQAAMWASQRLPRRGGASVND